MQLGAEKGKGQIDLVRHPPMLTDAPSCDNIFEVGFKLHKGKLTFANYLKVFSMFVPYTGKYKDAKTGAFKPHTIKDKFDWVWSVMCSMAGCSDGKMSAPQLVSLFKDFLPPNFIAEYKSKLPVAAKQVIEELAGAGKTFITKQQFVDHANKYIADPEQTLCINLDGVSGGRDGV